MVWEHEVDGIVTLTAFQVQHSKCCLLLDMTTELVSAKGVR